MYDLSGVGSYPAEYNCAVIGFAEDYGTVKAVYDYDVMRAIFNNIVCDDDYSFEDFINNWGYSGDKPIICRRLGSFFTGSN